MKKKYAVGVVIIACILAIFLGKLIRHTLMKESLVNTGIGWYMIEYIKTGNPKFGLTMGVSETADTVSVTDNTNAFFIIINIFRIKTYYGYEFYISIIWNLILLSIIAKTKKNFSLSEIIFIVSSVAILNIFDFCLAKEPVQMLYFILMYAILSSTKSEKFKFMSCAGVFVLCFMTYRNYYILMFGFMIYVHLIYKLLISKVRKVKIKHILIVLVSIFICYLVFLNIAKLLDQTSYNELIRVRLRISTAASDMRAIFKSRNLPIFTLDYIIMLIRMLIPVELAKLGPKYIVYTLYQIMITYTLIKNFRKINKVNGTRRISMYVYIAFIMGSAAFEPDFGSWIRHEAVLFPILLVMSNIKEVEEVGKNEEVCNKTN